MTKPPTSDAAGAVLRKAMARAFVLGQAWWAQADSESFRQNKKADITRAAFDALVNETVAALSTQQPPAGSVGVPEGWVLVPKVPTEGMVSAGNDEGNWGYGESSLWRQDGDAQTVYAAMLSAAPAPKETP